MGRSQRAPPDSGTGAMPATSVTMMLGRISGACGNIPPPVPGIGHTAAEVRDSSKSEETGMPMEFQ